MKFHLFIMFSNSIKRPPGDKTAQLSRFESLKCSQSAKSINAFKSIYLRPYMSETNIQIMCTILH